MAHEWVKQVNTEDLELLSEVLWSAAPVVAGQESEYSRAVAEVCVAVDDELVGREGHLGRENQFDIGRDENAE